MTAFVIEKLAYKAFVYARESSWQNAQNRSSLLHQTYFSGYVSHRKDGAFGAVLCSSDSNFSDLWVNPNVPITFPRWTQFSDVDNSIFVYSTQEVTYFNGQIGSLSIPVKQGEPKEFEYIALGLENEEIEIFDDSTDDKEIEIFIVNNLGVVLATVNVIDEPYLVNELVNYNAQVINAYDFSKITVRFGDGKYTRRLIAGERVLIKYSTTDGNLGNITGTGVIAKVATVVKDANGGIPTLYFRNSQQISDGRGYEDIESIRKNGRNLFGAGYRLADKKDWQSVIENEPVVNKAIVFTEIQKEYKLSGDTTPTIGPSSNIVHLSAVSNDGTALTDAQESDIVLNKLIPLKCPTDVIQFERLGKIFMKVRVTGTVKTGSAFTEVISQTDQLLIDKFGVLASPFGQDIFQSNYYRVIDESPSMLHHTTEAFYAEEAELDALDPTGPPWNKNAYTIQVSKPVALEPVSSKQIYLQQDSFEIWIRRKIANVWQTPVQIASTSGITITGMNGFTILGGTVNYSLNQVTFGISELIIDSGNNWIVYGPPFPDDTDPDGFILYFIYKSVDGLTGQAQDLRLAKFTQIFDVFPVLNQYNLSYPI